MTSSIPLGKDWIIVTRTICIVEHRDTAGAVDRCGGKKESWEDESELHGV